MTNLELPLVTHPVQNIGLKAVGLVALVILLLAAPFLTSEYWINAIIVPFLILSLAGLGLNLLTGYAGQLSLGAGAFMMVGAYATFAFQLRVPELPLPLALIISGLISGVVGLAFGLPSTRIKGFYLIVSTLTAQFFFEWLFLKFPWFYNGNSSATIALPHGLSVFGLDLNNPHGRYFLTLGSVALLTWLSFNLVRSQTGRNWMAIRDMDTAAAVIGVPTFRAKLQAFAVSSFILGIAGALWAFTYLGSASVQSFGLTRSYQILFIIIIGGLGTIRGAYLGAAFVSLLPLALDWLFQYLFSGHVDAGLLQNIQKAIFGILIIWFLIKEPEGLSRLLGLRRAHGARRRLFPS
ncbi:branched-chain amino acid ABC transporter permease [Agrobacterium vitis]|uniref:ABC transporter membrane spanning protein (Branched chain amino acid) n=2 Tax=Rhizobium/Agrobacterium group TaxID=227290 RepID=B9K4R6_ALLAM|nr:MULTISPECIES: branched-chain amino acid ABC transporter permease [Rhizobium/Agrobacterium group]ACM39864.1 ABC transporter membrane spanning protein (branched chain amino acid) [Allorhizobium ampelinum S4]MCF1447979.1 branched-chain amino acid ABC transporter permease [Allorhizobium ampelinum]MCF1462045.1 branched-chain amino acid ABC transporter permease [Allorhizobium ampelinum]MCF1495263.1 branched-chain amino acid ABC transporter permease [Allorhizobium ampelinum]MUO28647.1 branched-cha